MIDRALDIRFLGQCIHMDMETLSGGKVATIYGQAEVVKDLIAARVKSGGALLFEADAHVDRRTLTPSAQRFATAIRARSETLECDFVAGCDGFHGISRPAIPESALSTYDRIFPFGWLGILSESPPLVEMTYANHDARLCAGEPAHAANLAALRAVHAGRGP